LPYWATVNNVKAVFGALSSPVFIPSCLFLSAVPDVRFLTFQDAFLFCPHSCFRTLLSFLMCSFCLCNKMSVRHGHMLLLIWPVLCIIPILKSQRMSNDSAPFFSSYVCLLKRRLFVYVYPLDCKVRSAACRDNAHMYYRKRKGFISKMDPVFFPAVFSANDKDGIAKYISEFRVVLVESVLY